MQTSGGEIQQLLDRADELLDANRAAEAQALYEQIVLRDPRHHEAWMMLGSLLSEAGETERGLEYLNRAVELKPDSAHAHFVLGHVLRATGRTEAAMQHFEAACEHNSEDPQYKLALWKLKLERGAPDEATDLIGQALAAGAGDSHTRYLLACTLHRSGDITGAVHAYQEVLAVDEHHYDATRYLASALTSLGDYGRAETIVANAIERFGGTPDLHHQYAVVLLQQGKCNVALEHCVRALERAPDKKETRIVQADALQATGDYDGALDILQPMLEADRVPPDAALVFVKLSVIFDMREEATALLDKIECATSLGEHELTQFAKARAWLQEH